MNNQQEPFVDGSANADQVVFLLRVELIAKGENKWVIEYRPAFFKTDFMLC